MKAATKDRCVAIATEIRELAFMAGSAKRPRQYFNRIHTLAKEACDYFAFGFDAPVAAAPTEPEPVGYGFTCGIPCCSHDDSETEQETFATMREALDAADAHRTAHQGADRGVVTTEVA